MSTPSYPPQQPYGQQPYGGFPPGGGVPPYGGGPGWPAPGDVRPGAVTAAGIITVAVGVLGIVGGVGLGLLVALFGALMGQMAEGKSPGSGEAAEVTTFFVAVALGIALISVVVATLHLWLGLRVLKRGRVARIVLTVWNGLGVVAALVVAVATVVQSQDLGLAVQALVTAAPAAAVVTLLWIDGSREWFDQGRGQDHLPGRR